MRIVEEVVIELVHSFCLFVGYTYIGIMIVTAVVGESELSFDLLDSKITNAHVVFQQTEGTISIGLLFLQSMAEKYFTIDSICSTSIGYRNYHFIPSIGA